MTIDEMIAHWKGKQESLLAQCQSNEYSKGSNQDLQSMRSRMVDILAFIEHLQAIKKTLKKI